ACADHVGIGQVQAPLKLPSFDATSLSARSLELFGLEIEGELRLHSAKTERAISIDYSVIRGKASLDHLTASAFQANAVRFARPVSAFSLMTERVTTFECSMGSGLNAYFTSVGTTSSLQGAVFDTISLSEAQGAHLELEDARLKKLNLTQARFGRLEVRNVDRAVQVLLPGFTFQFA